MASRGQGIAKKTPSKKLPSKGGMSVGGVSSERDMPTMAKGGKCYARGGKIDGVAKKGKTRGKMV
jgi:hypothetical protein